MAIQAWLGQVEGFWIAASALLPRNDGGEGVAPWSPWNTAPFRTYDASLPADTKDA